MRSVILHCKPVPDDFQLMSYVPSTRRYHTMTIKRPSQMQNAARKAKGLIVMAINPSVNTVCLGIRSNGFGAKKHVQEAGSSVK